MFADNPQRQFDNGLESETEALIIVSASLK